MTAEQQQDEVAAAAAAAELAAFVDAWEAAELPNIVAHTARASRDGERPGIYRQKLTVQMLRAVLAERADLAARVAELTGEREADTRAVAELVKLGDVSFQGTWLTDWEDAKGALAARFADRITTLAAAEPAATCTPPRDWWRTRGACRYCGCDVHENDPAEQVGNTVAHPACHQRAQEWIAECDARRDRRQADAMAADAVQDGLSATETDDGASRESVDGNTSSILPQGLSEPEPERDPSAWCWAPNPHTLLHCGLLRDHEPPHQRGERTWTDDTTAATSESPSRARLPIGDYAASWYDDAPITGEQLSGLNASVENGELPSYSRFVVRKVLAEVDRLRARLDEIGETREEFGALYLSWANSSHGEIRHVGPFKTADEVREASQAPEWPLMSRDAWDLGRRLTGEWREVPDA